MNIKLIKRQCPKVYIAVLSQFEAILTNANELTSI